MLGAFGRATATYCDIMGVVGSGLKMIEIFMQQHRMLHDVSLVWPGSCNNAVPGHAHSFKTMLRLLR